MIEREEIESKQLIRKAAYELIYLEGFGNTSYTAISEKCGLGRPLVQKHFPKKEQLLCDLMEDIINACIFQIEENYPDNGHPAANTTRVVQLFYSVMFQNSISTRLAKYSHCQESSSGLVSTLLSNYAASLLDLDAEPEKLRNTVVWILGGLGQVLIDRANGNGDVDVDDITVRSLAALLVVFKDERYSDISDSLKHDLLDQSQIEPLVEEVMEKVF